MELIRGAWRKSLRSSEQGDNCIELGASSGAIAVRDSKDPDGPKIIMSRSDFRRLVGDLKQL